MKGKSFVYKSGLPAESIGIMKISLWSDEYLTVENHSGIADMKKECVKLYQKKRLLAINGENLVLDELDGCNLKLKGKILSIEYLT